MDVKMWPIQIAKDSVFEIAALGYNGIKLFARLDTSPKFIEDSWEKDLESYDEVIDRIATICGTGQDYFRMWLRDDKKELNYEYIKDIDSITFETNGVYYLEFNGNESHYFILIILDDTITYAATYGGVQNIIVKEFNKFEYRERFINAMMGSLSDYEYVFQVNAEVNEVNFESLGVVKSSRYM
jgi:hypothetical protein